MNFNFNNIDYTPKTYLDLLNSITYTNTPENFSDYYYISDECFLPNSRNWNHYSKF